MIRISNLCKSYPGQANPAIADLSLEVEEGSFLTLLGASGCGKTTTLRCLAGLEQPDSGTISINGKVVFSREQGINLPSHERQLGMVFQSYAIWPHMTVFENVAYPLRCIGAASSKIDEAVKWALSLVNLSDFATRPAPLLSGGQQQRVALARSLVSRPNVLLLDEPLSNLDAKLRDQMRFELRDLLAGLNMTAVYVTHDQDEAFSLSDITALMHGGRIIELDHPAKIYDLPRTQFGAEFLGFSTKLAGTVRTTGEALSVETEIGAIECRSASEHPVGSKVSVYLRPEEFQIAQPGKTDSRRHLNVKIRRTIQLGGIFEWWVEYENVVLRGRLPTGSSAEMSFRDKKVGDHVDLILPHGRCVPDDS